MNDQSITSYIIIMFMKNKPNDMYIVHITSINCYVMPIQLGSAIHVLHFFIRKCRFGWSGCYLLILQIVKYSRNVKFSSNCKMLNMQIVNTKKNVK